MTTTMMMMHQSATQKIWTNLSIFLIFSVRTLRQPKCLICVGTGLLGQSVGTDARWRQRDLRTITTPTIGKNEQKMKWEMLSKDHGQIRSKKLTTPAVCRNTRPQNENNMFPNYLVIVEVKNYQKLSKTKDCGKEKPLEVKMW